MRLRSTLTAAVGSLALVLALPAAAHAASGSFSYVYGSGAGEYLSALVDPPSRQCLAIPVPGPSAARSPRNTTDATATVYTGAGCTGASYVLRAYDGQGSPLVGVRSVMFS
ncbi:hypothetical protein GCM10018793_19170 [Streptomyces sulfonofaciens]|uniref:Uncharacterized protein n=1 Tax=Streptomyces sulfonofaciens TaxID=68272 RepID=A0A919KWZ3_9ACTN|nr:hypothetical protein [Streptomyces sulfonofaciens]GHH75553.1 hypothetical protein GCM10018793_19170 [Streptomyces sulfonofaciens]